MCLVSISQQFPIDVLIPQRNQSHLACCALADHRKVVPASRFSVTDVERFLLKIKERVAIINPCGKGAAITAWADAALTAVHSDDWLKTKGEIAYGAHHGDSEAVALHAEAVEVTTENVVRANSNWLPYFDSRSLADTDFPVINPDRFGMQISIDTIGQDGGNRTISAQPADPSPIFVPLFMRASNWIEYPLVDVYRGSVVKDLALSQFDVARDRAWRTDALLASYVLYGGERDTKGRVQSVVSSWESTSYSYAKDGGLMRVENTRGGKSATAEFKDGRVRKITSADGGVTLFDYHEKSNLVGAPRGVQCANGLKLAHEYTEDGRLQTIAVGTARCVRLGYDAKGRVNEYALEPLADSPE